jgi:hypothetical protein
MIPCRYASAQTSDWRGHSITPLAAVSTRLFTSQLMARGSKMLSTIAIVLLILWVLGLVTSYTIGGFIHILLVVAVVMILIRVISGRRI